MFKKGQEVTVNAMGDTKNAVVLEDTKGDSTRLHISYTDPLKGTSASIKMNIANNMIKLK